jgi:RNA polymerase sigma factor (sigma-70 family)
MNSGPGITKNIIDFFQARKGQLIHFIRKNLRDSAERDAEDILQDVMLYIIESSDPAVPIENIAAYIYRSVRNRIIDQYIKPVRTVSLDAPSAGDGTPALSEILADLRYDTHNEAERREIMKRIYKALEELPVDQMAVWTAIELEDRHFEELSILWDEPIGTLLARKHRATAALRKKLADFKI